MPFFVENVDRTLNQNKDCKFGHDTASKKIIKLPYDCCGISLWKVTLDYGYSEVMYLPEWNKQTATLYQ
jgi:hypothetical protein